MEIPRGFTTGNVIWIEHSDKGDVYYRVKVVFERQPSDHEPCKNCHRGTLTVLGHIVQYGILDDEYYAVSSCSNCCGLTVFKYHVSTESRILPEEGSCEPQTAEPTNF